MNYLLAGLLIFSCQASQGMQAVNCSTWLNSRIEQHQYSCRKMDIPVLHSYHGGVWNVVAHYTVGDFGNAPGLDNAYDFVRAGASGIRKVLDGSSIGLAPMAIPNIPAGTNIIHAFSVQLNDISEGQPMLFRPQWGFYGHWLATKKQDQPLNLHYQCPSVMRIYLGGIDNGKESRNNWLDVDFRNAPEVSFHTRDGGDPNERLNSPNSHHLPDRVQNTNISYAVIHCTYYPYFNKVVYGTIIVLSKSEFDALRQARNQHKTIAEGLRGIPLVQNSIILQQIFGLTKSK